MSIIIHGKLYEYLLLFLFSSAMEQLNASELSVDSLFSNYVFEK